MIKLKINGVVVKEFVLHNDSNNFIPYTIDTFVTCSQPMYYQPVYWSQPVFHIQQPMPAMCANTMPSIEEPVVENKPIRLFAGIRHGEHTSVNVNDPEKYRGNPDFEKYLTVMKDTLGDFTTALNNDEFCDLADIGECNANELLDIATGVAEIKELQNECNLNETIATILKPDTDFNVDSERTRSWIMSGRAYIWFISQQAFINKDNKRVKFITQNLGSACTDIYNAAVGVICAFCKKYNEKFPTPFNSNVFDMPISKISKNVSNDSTGILTNVINAKAGGMYEEEYLHTRINYNDMPCDTERLAIAGSGSLKNALDRVSMTTGNTDYETLYNIGKESEQFLEDTICGNAIKSLSSTSVSDITRLAVGFVPDTDFNVDSQKTRDWIMSGKASMWVLLEKTLLSNGQVVHGDGAHRFYYEVLGLIKAFCDKYNVIPPSPFNSNVLGTELFIMDCHLNNNHAKRLFHDMSNANRGVM